MKKRKNKKLHFDEGERYVIVRTYSKGVFAGFIKSRIGKKVQMWKARRIKYWEGAASLSQLAMEGVKLPDKCQFLGPKDYTGTKWIEEVIEILDVTPEAMMNIVLVPVWIG